MSDATTAAAFWDSIAERYAATPVKDPAAFERKKAITRAALGPAATVLEVGSGTGTLALELAACAAHVHALDVSPSMTAIAERKREAAGVANVTFHTGTLDGLADVLPAQVDAVLAFSLLHLVPDRPALLAALRARLRPGGRLVSSNVCLGASRVPMMPLLTLMRWLGRAPRVYAYDRATLVRELDGAGFVDVVEHDVGAGATIAFVTATAP